MVVLAAAALVTLIGGTLYMQRVKKDQVQEETFVEPANTTPPVSADTNAPTPTPAPKIQGTVIFDVIKVASAADQEQLITRVVYPLTEYYKQAGGQELALLHLTVNENTNKSEYPYKGKVQFKESGTNEFLIGKTGDQIAWWYPECLGECPMNETYKAKYPEVVKAVGQ